MCVCVFDWIFSRSGVIEKLEALELENQEKMEVEESGRSGDRQGRSEHRRFHREVTLLCVCVCASSGDSVKLFAVDTVEKYKQHQMTEQM